MPTQTISDQDLAKEIRKNLMLVKSTDKHNRDAYRDNTKFLNLDQWDPQEAEKRRNKRLMLTADQLNAPVDQVVNGVRQNKPGPEVSPSGEGTDKEDAQIMGGILRRIDYENRSWIAFETAFEDATGGNFGCFEVDIDYKNERSFERKILVKPIPNANEMVWIDPSALEKDRSDMEWAIVEYSWTKEKYKREFPKSKINQMGKISSLIDYFGAMFDDSMSGWVSDDNVIIAKYWKIQTNPTTLYLCSDNTARFKEEELPAGVTYLDKPKPRPVDLKQVNWYLTDGVEILKRGTWEGRWIPLFPVYGRERWIRNKRVITSMIQGAKQAQQAFNYAFTGACEMLALSIKAPWLGLLGQFRSKYNDWKKANTEPLAYLEFDMVELPNGQTHVSPPVRNVQEPPIQGFLQFCQLCVTCIQRATSMFDPSLGKQKSDQSGKAIQELQQQSVEGNFHWSDNLTITLTHYYRALADLVQKEYDNAQVTQILRANNTPLEVEINKEFSSGPLPSGKKMYNIAKGNFAFTISIGQAADSQMQANRLGINNLIKVLPPELIAQAADIIIQIQNYGALGEELAQRLKPAAYQNQNDPQAQAAHLAQLMQQNTAMMQELQKLQQMIASKQPELEVRKQIAVINAVAGIEEAMIKAGDNREEREQSLFEHVSGIAHEAATDQADRVHDLTMAKVGQQHNMESQSAAQDAASADKTQQQGVDLAMQQRDHDNEPEESEEAETE